MPKISKRSHPSRIEMVIYILKHSDACAPLVIELIYIVEKITLYFTIDCGNSFLYYVIFHSKSLMMHVLCLF